MTESIYKNFSLTLKGNIVNLPLQSVLEQKIDGYWFVFREGDLIHKVNKDEQQLLRTEDIETFQSILNGFIHFGTLFGKPCFACEIRVDFDCDYLETIEELQLTNLRAMYGMLPDDIFHVAGRGLQLISWNNQTKYCGCCGGQMKLQEKEVAKQCPVCGLTDFPKISPAIIVAILKGEQLLLARNGRFPRKMYSIIAGFVEAGETLEDCVVRETYEEVGIKVKNIKYIASQPWPYPNSLMIGFVAEYKSGDILVDGDEIVEATWFDKENLPEIPPKPSIARKIIDKYLDGSIYQYFLEK